LGGRSEDQAAAIISASCADMVTGTVRLKSGYRIPKE
jgi:hypothetical protein